MPPRQFVNMLIDRFYIKQPRFRRLVTRSLEGDSDQQIDVCGTQLTINTIKEHGYLRASRLCRSSSLLRDEISVMLNIAFLLDDHDTFVDVGANVGLFSHTFSRFRRMMPGLRIYAFEANPDTYSRLTRHPDSINPQQIAISDKTGDLEFVEGAVSHVFTTTQHANVYHLAGQTRRVPCRRLDECQIEGDSLVIKIDVEGQELEVIQGAKGLFDSNRVKAVYVDGYENRAVESTLKSHGLTLFEGRTLEPTQGGVFSLLAINPKKHAGLPA